MGSANFHAGLRLEGRPICCIFILVMHENENTSRFVIQFPRLVLALKFGASFCTFHILVWRNCRSYVDIFQTNSCYDSFCDFTLCKLSTFHLNVRVYSWCDFDTKPNAWQIYLNYCKVVFKSRGHYFFKTFIEYCIQCWN